MASPVTRIKARKVYFWFFMVIFYKTRRDKYATDTTCFKYFITLLTFHLFFKNIPHPA
jgi:hypothetical protein